VNRTVAQIHALLYLSDCPLPAEDIADALGVARSNVSTSLKELQGWKLIVAFDSPGRRARDVSLLHGDGEKGALTTAPREYARGWIAVYRGDRIDSCG
jgi:biotin operon repressor